MRDVWWSELHRVNKFSPRVLCVDYKGENGEHGASISAAPVHGAPVHGEG